MAANKNTRNIVIDKISHKLLSILKNMTIHYLKEK